MENKYIRITEYCQKREVEESFIILLENSGLIELTLIDDHRYIHESQLMDLERFTIWHYELEINTPGIEALYHLVSKVKSLQHEIEILKQKLKDLQ